MRPAFHLTRSCKNRNRRIIGEEDVAGANMRGGPQGLMVRHAPGYSGVSTGLRGLDEVHTYKTKAAAKKAAASGTSSSNSSDQVDLGREVARDLKTNFLLANRGLCPDFHGVSSSMFDRFFLLEVYLVT